MVDHRVLSRRPVGIAQDLTLYTEFTLYHM